MIEWIYNTCIIAVTVAFTGVALRQAYNTGYVLGQFDGHLKTMEAFLENNKKFV